MNRSSIETLTAPWPTDRGGPDHGNRAPGIATATGVVRWSLPLPAPSAVGLAVDAAGDCLVAGDTYLWAVTPEGTIRWQQAAAIQGPPLVLPNGDLVIGAGERITLRDSATGQIRRRLPIPGTALASAWGTEGIVVSGWSAAGPPQLQAWSLDGTCRWVQPLTDTLLEPPLVLPDRIVVGDRSWLRTYTLDGAARERAGIAGVAPATVAADAGTGPADRVDGPVVALDAHTTLAGLVRATARGLYRVDWRQGQVTRQAAGGPWPAPYAVLPPGPSGGSDLLTVGWDGPVDVGVRPTPLQRIAPDGTVGWEQWITDGQPHTIIADAAGTSFVACSPTRDRWSKFARWADLVPECFVRAFSGAGQELFTWYAPGPITPRLALGATGDLYVVAAGRLWDLA